MPNCVGKWSQRRPAFGTPVQRLVVVGCGMVIRRYLLWKGSGDMCGWLFQLRAHTLTQQSCAKELLELKELNDLTKFTLGPAPTRRHWLNQCGVMHMPRFCRLHLDCPEVGSIDRHQAAQTPRDGEPTIHPEPAPQCHEHLPGWDKDARQVVRREVDWW